MSAPWAKIIVMKVQIALILQAALSVLVMQAILEMVFIVKVCTNSTCMINDLYFQIIDIDECQNDSSNCSQFANCTNTIGSFTCECDIGYTGDAYESSCVGMIINYDSSMCNLDYVIVSRY